MKLTPRSSALWSEATESDSDWGPQLPPMAHAPNPISETFRPVWPNLRNFMQNGVFGSIIPVCPGRSRNPQNTNHRTVRRGYTYTFLIDQKALWSVFDILISS